jgi:ADP-heptose:LPS heptosyltransferase
MSIREVPQQLTALVVRPGAIGDVLETMSVCAGLKRKGYRVTLLTSDIGKLVATNNPNVDEILTIPHDLVKTHTPQEIGDMWFEMGRAYDVFAPLAQVVEGTLIASPAFSQYHINPAARHRMCNINFLEFLHLASGVPYVPEVRFYPTGEELAWARDARRKMDAPFVLLLVLHGSAVHKIWPHNEWFIRKVLRQYEDVHIITTGMDAGLVYELPWLKHPRVQCSCSRLTARQFLTLPHVVDAIVGPETGVFYAASQMAVPKIMLLSHGTRENTARDWVNCDTVSAESVQCKGRGNNEAPACHQLHADWSTCTRVSNVRDCRDCRAGHCSKHLAACMQEILPAAVLDRLAPIVERHREQRSRIVVAA